MRQFYFQFILFKRTSIFTNHFIWVENENDFVWRWIRRCKCRFYYTLRRNDKWPKWSHHRRDLMTCFALNFIHSNDSFIHKPFYFRQRWMSRDTPHFMILVGESVYNRYQFLLLLLLLVQVNGDSQISIWMLLCFFPTACLWTHLQITVPSTTKINTEHVRCHSSLKTVFRVLEIYLKYTFSCLRSRKVFTRYSVTEF